MGPDMALGPQLITVLTFLQNKMAKRSNKSKNVAAESIGPKSSAKAGGSDASVSNQSDESCKDDTGSKKGMQK